MTDASAPAAAPATLSPATSSPVTLSPGAAREALAEAYRDAALAEADMVAAVGTLEGIRTVFAGPAGMFEAWAATNAAVGRSSPGPLRAVLAALRDGVQARLLGAHLQHLRSLPPDGDDRAVAWLTLVASALVRLRVDVVAAVSSVDVPPRASEVARLVGQHLLDLDRSSWGEAWELFQAVAHHDLVPDHLRVPMGARCAEIALFFREDPQACRLSLERASEPGLDCAPLANAWGAYWLSRGDLDTARSHLLRAVRLDETFPTAYVNLGESYENEDDLHAASTWFESGRAQCPGEAEPYLRLVRFYTRPDQVERHGDAIPGLIELAQAVAPFSVGDAYLSAAVAYDTMGDTEVSDRWLQRLFELDPGRTDALTWSASVCAGRHQCDQAFSAMRVAEGAAPGSFDVGIAMANVCQRCGRPEEAPAWIQRALERRPSAEARTRLWLAQAYRQVGDLRSAEEEIIRSLRIRPDAEEAASGLAVIMDDCVRDGGRASAEALLARVLDAVGPSWDAWYHNGWGDLAFGQGDYQGAAAAYQAAIDRGPDVALFHRNLAAAGRELNRFDEARLALSDALALDHDLLQFRSEGGLVANSEANHFYGAEDYASAVPRYQEAARLRPHDLVVFTNLASAWERLDDPPRRREAAEGARAALRRAAELAPDDAALAVRLAGVEAVLEAQAEFGPLAIEPLPLVFAVRLLLAQDLLADAVDASRELSDEVRTTIAALRTRLRDELGVTLPGINLADDPSLAEGTTRIEFDGVLVAEAVSPLHHRYFAGTTEDLDRAGVDVQLRSPARLAGGRGGWWIAEPAWVQAEASGLELRSRLAPMLACLGEVVNANVHHLIGIDGVAGMIGPALAGEAPADLVGFTNALRLHVADDLSIGDPVALWSAYREERATGATLTAAAEALRRLPGPRARIEGWSRDGPTVWVGEDREAWIAERRLELGSGPVLAIDAVDAARLPELVGPLAQADRGGCVLVARDASLRPVVAWLLREMQVVATVIADRELPDGVSPARPEELRPDGGTTMEDARG